MTTRLRDNTTASVTVIDAIKAVASQVIVLHHLAFYGLLSSAVEPYAPSVLDWLSEYGRIAVQCFLVVGGFLAARSLMPGLDAAWRPVVASSLPGLLWKRYVRLMRPYIVALLLAVAAAWLARELVADADTPQAPTLAQFGWHLLLLQDLVRSPALSAGVWYVAIDMQLYALLALICFARPAAARIGLGTRAYALIVCGGLTLASLLWINCNADQDDMALYFFGAYGLGIAAHWAGTSRYREWGAAAVAALVLLALAFEWRSRVAMAGVTALALIAFTQAPPWSGATLLHRAIRGLSRISYSVFLVHYPVFLAIGSLVRSTWPDSAMASGLGLVVIWASSLAGGALLHHFVEEPGLHQCGSMRRSGSAVKA